MSERAAVIDGLIDSILGRFNLSFQMGGVKINLWMSGKRIKLGVEHADDLPRFIVQNSLCLTVPKHGYGNSPGVVRRCFYINLPEVVRPILTVRNGTGIVRKFPPALVANDRVYNLDANQ
ncbi:MAG: hypothetical protein AAF152_19770 [Cyanobacteria bacterium P01_A01_bin.114]